MSIKTMTRVWDASERKGSSLLLLLALADYADDQGICWPSVAALAGKIRMSPRQTHRMLDGLIASGEVYTAERSGRGNTNRYAVLTGLDDSQIEALLRKQFGLSPLDVAAWFAGRDLPASDDSTVLDDDDTPPTADEPLENSDNLSPFPEQNPDISDTATVTDSLILLEKGDIFPRKGDIAVSHDPLTVKVKNRQIHQNPPTPHNRQKGGGSGGEAAGNGAARASPWAAMTPEEEARTRARFARLGLEVPS